MKMTIEDIVSRKKRRIFTKRKKQRMIKDMPDSEYLEMLAHWFYIERLNHRWEGEAALDVQENLERIAKNLRKTESNKCSK